MRHIITRCVLAIIILLPATAAAQDDIAIIPRPQQLERIDGHFVLDSTVVIVADAAAEPLARQLASWLAPATGWRLAVRRDAPARARHISLALDPRATGLGAEGYRLTVEPTKVRIEAAAPAGLFYGMQSLRQLLPPDIFRSARVEGVAWRMPAVRIEDRPRFGWRGAHLDVARHFMPKAFVLRFIDLMALHKLNSFHWHLTDDQGWRLEIRRYPRLTSVGAWRPETMIPPYQSDPALRRFDSTPHGGFYTQDDVREVVAYAAARHIRVMPEIEMPGHSVAAIAAYPELGVTGDSIGVATWWGVFDDILNADDATIRFQQDVLTEVMELFPGTFIHVGGDEAAKGKWEASPRIQARIRELGVEDEHGLQSWFIRQMDAFLTRHGRRLVGWDEILEGGLAPGATVMSWRGTRGGIAAARQGHDVVMAPTSHTYLDYYQSAEQDAEPHAIGGFLPIDTVYAFEPVPAELEPQFHRHILGAQVQLWTEYIPNPRHAEYMAYPRTSALSEVVWTDPARKDFTDFQRRLAIHARRLEALDVNFRGRWDR